MKLAILSDLHVLGPGEMELHEASLEALGDGLPRHRSAWRHFLHRIRRRLWVDHPEARHASFVKALKEIRHYDPDKLVVNGDYGGDTGGIGLSCEHTFESAASVIESIRAHFPNRCNFVFGDHDIGKYSTAFRGGGIRLDSITRGEQQLGIRSFWEERLGDFHLVGVNSSLLTLHLFLPEALADEVSEWQRLREDHIRQLQDAFSRLGADEQVILFCHDPGALSVINGIPEVRQRIHQIKLTVLGHYHDPRLLSLAKLVPPFPNLQLKYPVARILFHGISDARSWARYNPVVCPATYGTGQHVRGGCLFIETNARGELVTRRRRLAA